MTNYSAAKKLRYQVPGLQKYRISVNVTSSRFVLSLRQLSRLVHISMHEEETLEDPGLIYFTYGVSRQKVSKIQYARMRYD